MNRLTDIECLMARMEKAIGVTAIHTIWTYDHPIDDVGLRKFHAALADGRLGRVAVRSTIHGAGDRWSARATIAELDFDSRTIAATDLSDWFAAKSREQIDIYGGPAWRLSAINLDNGGGAVSLLASHALGDGYWISRAISDAAEGKQHRQTFPADSYSAVRIQLSDYVATAHRLGRFVAARLRRLRSGPGPTPAMAKSSESRPEDWARVSAEWSVPRAWAQVSAADWRAAVDANNGTSTSLAVAITAAIAISAHRVDADGSVLIAMPASTRKGADDPRANAIHQTGLRIAVPGTAGVPEIRKLIKSAAAGLSQHPSPIPELMVSDETLTRAFRNGQRFDSVTSICSVVGEVPAAVRCADGTRAHGFAMFLVSATTDVPAMATDVGGTLRTGLIEADQTVTIHFTGYHPPDIESDADLRSSAARAFDTFGLTPEFT